MMTTPEPDLSGYRRRLITDPAGVNARLLAALDEHDGGEVDDA